MRDPFLRAEVAELVQKHGLSGDAREDLEVVIRRVVTQNALEDALTLSRAGDLATLRRSGRIDPSDATLEIFLSGSGSGGGRGEGLEGGVGGMVVSGTDPERFKLVGQLGQGGHAEVLRVWDPALERCVAMKVLRREHAADERAVARFFEEASITAQLQHPGVVPVFERGRTADGRYFFTMQEVRGRTLKDLLREAHAATSTTWSQRRLLELFRKVCEPVAYAHSLQVLHRDLKPSNVMVGDFGEVLVMDWGVAVIHGERSPQPHVAGFDAEGSVTGTPAYMAPEQARGEPDLGPRADVYALGAILYELLTGRPPYTQRNGLEALDALLRGPPPPPSAVAPRPIPEELEAICLRAMAREPQDRFEDALALSDTVGEWLEGVRSRERALEIVSRADALLPEAARLREQADAARAQFVALSEGLTPVDPVEKKRPAWEAEDEATRLESLARRLELRRAELLNTALHQVPDLDEAHARLADLFAAEHQAAEARRDEAATAIAETHLRRHDRGAWRAYLSGEGAVSLITDPPGARVTLYRYVTVDRRLVPELVDELGETPLHHHRLPMGSYLLRVRAEGHEEVSYPVHIRRQGFWDGIAPGDTAPSPIWLPPIGALGRHERYVPSGWFLAGGDEMNPDSPPLAPVWVDGFIIDRFPTTNEEYLTFLNDLIDQGHEDDALRWAPRERRGVDAPDGALVVHRDAHGHFELGPDQDGDVWLPDWPALFVSCACAEAYARWRGARDKLPTRLLIELEWEKAGRGVDGRVYPWGDWLDPTYCCMRQSRLTRELPAMMCEFPVDESPYGVRHLAGNVEEWLADPWRQEGPLVDAAGRALPPLDAEDDTPRAFRGGRWDGSERLCHLARRNHNLPHHRSPLRGFRLGRNLP
ncbi:MAG: SUMF1/EgtB/PvdO family nonheme iron enzyme [Deltaproteobacteria bacterium]|nr:SUMF1/EgtB/PvdO family nonheme iron enzyme [Deltaproteobacteria bacterium]